MQIQLKGSEKGGNLNISLSLRFKSRSQEPEHVLMESDTCGYTKN